MLLAAPYRPLATGSVVSSGGAFLGGIAFFLTFRSASANRNNEYSTHVSRKKAGRCPS